MRCLTRWLSTSVRSAAPTQRRLVKRSRARALTLIEILVVMALLALVLGGVLVGSGQLASARLRQSASMLTGAIRVGYTRASATSKNVRLVMDFDKNMIWLEEASGPMVVKQGDKASSGGAEAATAAERAAIKEDEEIIKGPHAPKPKFRPVQGSEIGQKRGSKHVRELARSIRFKSVQTTHDAEPRKSGRAYLYFWPGGQTEQAAIQLRVGDSTEEVDIVTLLVSPLTGKTRIEGGPVELKVPTEDSEVSEREDTGSL